MIEVLHTALQLLAIATPICSAAYVVGKVRAELGVLRRDVDRAHERIDGVDNKLFSLR